MTYKYLRIGYIDMVMDAIYVFVVNGAEWEDLIIFLTKEEAIEKSKKCPNARVELFLKSETGGYYPSYTYYFNGELIEVKK